MKKFFHIITAALLLVFALSCSKPSSEIKVMSFNIRYDNPEDSLNNWQYRKDIAALTILGNDVDIVGAQEVMHNQLLDLLDRLPEYDYVGVGRIDGETKGEHSALFYNRNRFEKLSSDNFWLSETPEQPGKGWDAACERIATWAVLKDGKSGKEFFVLNTHLDHVGQTARRESVNVILEKIAVYSEGRPVIVTGDFNSEPGSEVITRITAAGTLHDSRSLAEESAIGENATTFHGFGKLSDENRTYIDYIFVSDGLSVKKFEILPDKLDGTFLSDHNPIIAVIEM